MPSSHAAMVVRFTTAAMLTAAGARTRDLGLLALALGFVILLAILIEPYRVVRLTGFLDPSF